MSSSLLGLAFPVTLIPAQPPTDDELIRFSEANKPCRVERTREGEIVVMTPVGGIGGTHEFYVASMLYAWTEETGTGIGFGSNTGFNLRDGSCLSPDAAWLSLSRWEGLTPEEQAGFPPLCPEFVMEVRSRGDRRRMVEEKMSLWMENGAELAWLVDPVEGNAAIYRAGKAVRMLERPDAIEGEGPVAGFVLRAARLWAGGGR